MLLPTPAAHALLERTPGSDARVDFGPVMLFCNPNAMCAEPGPATLPILTQIHPYA